MWQELQAQMDELPKAGHQEREVLIRGRADHSASSLDPRKQVNLSPSVVILV